ncbi:MAG: hypothetical protein RLZZ157_1250 [Pseudomonadota bacterium]|jgi:copper(I)-binding protein
MTIHSIKPAPARAISRRFLAKAVGLAVLAFTPAFAHDFKQGSLTIDHPIVTPSRGTIPVNAGYMTIKNAAKTADTLVSATSSAVGRIELHQHIRTKDGMMAMRPVAGGIAIPAKGQVVLQPGGLHLMIFDAKSPLKDGDYLPITLRFAKAGFVDIVAMVEAPSPKAGHHAH